ncbi:MAG TPA: hypothetical protein V6D27_07450 [Vampirovibrionales bacterium]
MAWITVINGSSPISDAITRRPVKFPGDGKCQVGLTAIAPGLRFPLGNPPSAVSTA